MDPLDKHASLVERKKSSNGKKLGRSPKSCRKSPLSSSQREILERALPPSSVKAASTLGQNRTISVELDNSLSVFIHEVNLVDPGSPNKRMASITQLPGSPSKRSRQLSETDKIKNDLETIRFDRLEKLLSPQSAGRQFNKSDDREGQTYLGYEINYGKDQPPRPDQPPRRMLRVMKGHDAEWVTSASSQASEIASDSPLAGYVYSLPALHSSSAYHKIVREWERSLLNETASTRRNMIVVGSNGHDKIIHAVYSSRRFVDIAKLVLGANRVTIHNEVYENPKDPRDGNWTGKQFLHLFGLSKVTDVTNVYVYSTFITLCMKKLLKDRIETYRCMACHPQFEQASDDHRRIYKQNLIDFFDKRLTSQIRHLTQSSQQQAITLRLGGDGTFRSEDGLNTGMDDDYGQMLQRNIMLWGEYLSTSASSLEEDLELSEVEYMRVDSP